MINEAIHDLAEAAFSERVLGNARAVAVERLVPLIFPVWVVSIFAWKLLVDWGGAATVAAAAVRAAASALPTGMLRDAARDPEAWAVAKAWLRGGAVGSAARGVVRLVAVEAVSVAWLVVAEARAPDALMNGAAPQLNAWCVTQGAWTSAAHALVYYALYALLTALSVWLSRCAWRARALREDAEMREAAEQASSEWSERKRNAGDAAAAPVSNEMSSLSGLPMAYALLAGACEVLRVVAVLLGWACVRLAPPCLPQGVGPAQVLGAFVANPALTLMLAALTMAVSLLADEVANFVAQFSSLMAVVVRVVVAIPYVAWSVAIAAEVAPRFATDAAGRLSVVWGTLIVALACGAAAVVFKTAQKLLDQKQLLTASLSITGVRVRVSDEVVGRFRSLASKLEGWATESTAARRADVPADGAAAADAAGAAVSPENASALPPRHMVEPSAPPADEAETAKPTRPRRRPRSAAAPRPHVPPPARELAGAPPPLPPVRPHHSGGMHFGDSMLGSSLMRTLAGMASAFSGFAMGGLGAAVRDDVSSRMSGFDMNLVSDAVRLIDDILLVAETRVYEFSVRVLVLADELPGRLRGNSLEWSGTVRVLAPNGRVVVSCDVSNFGLHEHREVSVRMHVRVHVIELYRLLTLADKTDMRYCSVRFDMDRGAGFAPLSFGIWPLVRRLLSSQLRPQSPTDSGRPAGLAGFASALVGAGREGQYGHGDEYGAASNPALGVWSALVNVLERTSRDNKLGDDPGFRDAAYTLSRALRYLHGALSDRRTDPYIAVLRTLCTLPKLCDVAQLFSANRGGTSRFLRRLQAHTLDSILLSAQFPRCDVCGEAAVARYVHLCEHEKRRRASAGAAYADGMPAALLPSTILWCALKAASSMR